MVDYEPRLTSLTQTCAQLRAVGQNRSSEELLRLTSQYTELTHHVSAHAHKLQAAVDVRKSYHASRAQLEEQLQQLQDDVSDDAMHEMTTTEKLDKYNV